MQLQKSTPLEDHLLRGYTANTAANTAELSKLGYFQA